MDGNEVKIGCLVFMLIMASKGLIPAKLNLKFPWIGTSIEVLAGVVITVVAFFALK